MNGSGRWVGGWGGPRANSKTPCRFRALVNIHPCEEFHMEKTQATFSVFDVGLRYFCFFHRYSIEAVTIPRISAADEDDDGEGGKSCAGLHGYSSPGCIGNHEELLSLLGRGGVGGGFCQLKQQRLTTCDFSLVTCYRSIVPALDTANKCPPHKNQS